MTSRRRAPILTAAVLALACAVPGAASGASPFRQVVAYSEGEITSDGERYATVGYGEPIFDTLRGRRFRPAPPVPDCRYGGFGGGLVVWDCAPPRQTLITNLATGRSREPAGIQRVYARTSPITYCTTGGVGRYWLEFSCGAGMGPRSEEYLNHRTGEIVDLSWVIRNTTWWT